MRRTTSIFLSAARLANTNSSSRSLRKHYQSNHFETRRAAANSPSQNSQLDLRASTWTCYISSIEINFNVLNHISPDMTNSVHSSAFATILADLPSSQCILQSSIYVRKRQGEHKGKGPSSCGFQATEPCLIVGDKGTDYYGNQRPSTEDDD